MDSYFFNCSEEYVSGLGNDIYEEIVEVIANLPRRSTQAEINADLFWFLASKGWSFDSVPSKAKAPPSDIQIAGIDLKTVKNNNQRQLCLTSTTLPVKWHCDFARIRNGHLIQIEAQFGNGLEGASQRLLHNPGKVVSYPQQPIDLATKRCTLTEE